MHHSTYATEVHAISRINRENNILSIEVIRCHYGMNRRNAWCMLARQLLERCMAIVVEHSLSHVLSIALQGGVGVGGGHQY